MKENGMKKYVVRLTGEERAKLQRLVSVGNAAARKILHARILLQADQGPDGPAWTDAQINAQIDLSILFYGKKHLNGERLTRIGWEIPYVDRNTSLPVPDARTEMSESGSVGQDLLPIARAEHQFTASLENGTNAAIQCSAAPSG
jgi:hypothetical protein